MFFCSSRPAAAAALLASALALNVQAADKVKVGFISTLSGPAARSASTSATASSSR